MSTRSFIAIKQADGTLLGNYCHYDGYPGHVGTLLAQFFDTKIRALNLIEGTHIRCLMADGSVDRFDEGEQSFADDVKDALSDVFDYVYVFDEADTVWKCFSRNRSGVIEECDIPQPA
jgi:hypothetical protein